MEVTKLQGMVLFRCHIGKSGISHQILHRMLQVEGPAQALSNIDVEDSLGTIVVDTVRKYAANPRNTVLKSKIPPHETH